MPTGKPPTRRPRTSRRRVIRAGCGARSRSRLRRRPRGVECGLQRLGRGRRDRQLRREKVNGLLGGLLKTVKERVTAALRAVAEGAGRIGRAMADTVRRARDLVTRLAKAARDLAVQVWKAAADRLTRLWHTLKSAAAAAIRAAGALVKKVAGALALVKEILKLFGNKLLGFIMDAVQDPQGKLVAPIVEKARPLVGGVPGKADQLAQQSAAQAGASTAGPTAQRAVVQRDAVAAPIAPPGETFWSGVWRHLKAAGDNFLANWAEILGKVVLDVLLWVPMIVQEGPALWNEVKSIFTGGGGVDRLDHVLAALRHLVSIVGGTLATIGVWGLIIALCGGPVAEGVALGIDGASIDHRRRPQPRPASSPRTRTARPVRASTRRPGKSTWASSPAAASVRRSPWSWSRWGSSRRGWRRRSRRAGSLPPRPPRPRRPPSRRSPCRARTSRRSPARI